MDKPTLYFIVGPTASGKTAISIAVAKQLSAEIISADSIQIYDKLDIGSAKPTLLEMDGVRHHMIGTVDPATRDYSVARYRKDALASAEDIFSRGKNALVVGGTGLYVNSLIYPLDIPKAPPNEALRSYYDALEAKDKGAAYRKLLEIDPASAKRLHPNDVKRVVRAIEICEYTGKPVEQPDFTRRADDLLPYSVRLAGLTAPRELLYERINTRVDDMLASGLVDEVKALLASGLDPSVPAMQGLGYKEVVRFINGEASYDETVETLKRETRRFAKRQLTWFRREDRIRWFDIAQGGELYQDIYSYFTEGDNG